MRPASFFTGKSTLLLSPPSVPRSVTTPFRHRAACSTVSPERFATPATQPLLLMLCALLPKTPPSVPRSMAVYRAGPFWAWAPRKSGNTVMARKTTLIFFMMSPSAFGTLASVVGTVNHGDVVAENTDDVNFVGCRIHCNAEGIRHIRILERGHGFRRAIDDGYISVLAKGVICCVVEVDGIRLRVCGYS